MLVFTCGYPCKGPGLTVSDGRSRDERRSRPAKHATFSTSIIPRLRPLRCGCALRLLQPRKVGHGLIWTAFSPICPWQGTTLWPRLGCHSQALLGQCSRGRWWGQMIGSPADRCLCLIDVRKTRPASQTSRLSAVNNGQTRLTFCRGKVIKARLDRGLRNISGLCQPVTLRKPQACAFFYCYI
jgi:hypothetical protein